MNIDQMVEGLKKCGSSTEEILTALSIAEATYQDKGNKEMLAIVQAKASEITQERLDGLEKALLLSSG